MRRLIALLGALALSACALPNDAETGAGGLAASPIQMSDLPGWTQTDPSAALASFVVSCKAIMLMPPDTQLGGDGLAHQLGGQAGLWDSVCAAAKDVPPNDQAAARQFFQSRFQAYEVLGQALITGYFEPEVPGAKNSEPGYRVPLYAKPSIASLANLPRAAIDDGALYRKTPVTAYVASPEVAFMLQVQGAGRIDLTNGRVLSVGFDGQNNQPYTPIGGILVKMGALNPDDLSYQSISAWLETHPRQARAIMEQNANYVYMRPIGYLPHNDGPLGALGVGLTAGHSIAVDQQALPLGAPVFVSTTNPTTHNALNVLTVAQDTGAGLTGGNTADIFFGTGPSVAQIAGAMHQSGTLYLLLPRS